MVRSRGPGCQFGCRATAVPPRVARGTESMRKLICCHPGMTGAASGGDGRERQAHFLDRFCQCPALTLESGRALAEVMQARDLIHTLVAPLPPRWDDEVLPVARKGRLVFFML